MSWELWYFNHWLMHLIYFTAGLIIIFAMASNYYISWKQKMIIFDRLERYSKLSAIDPHTKIAKEFEK